jgi:hypothetical protein
MQQHAISDSGEGLGCKAAPDGRTCVGCHPALMHIHHLQRAACNTARHVVADVGFNMALVHIHHLQAALDAEARSTDDGESALHSCASWRKSCGLPLKLTLL